MTDFSCPHCGSEDTRSFRVIAEDGTSSGTMDVSVSDISGRVSDGTSEVEVATDAARMAAKPTPAYSKFKELGRAGVVLGGALLVLGLLFGSDSPSFDYQTISIKGAGIAAVVLGIVSYLIGFAIDAGKDADLDQRTADWSKMWRCSRCGEPFQETGNDSYRLKNSTSNQKETRPKKKAKT